MGSREGVVGARPRRARRRREACARHWPRRARPLRRPGLVRRRRVGQRPQAVAVRYGRSIRRRARRDSPRLPDRGRRGRAAQERLRAGTPASSRRRGRRCGGAGRAGAGHRRRRHAARARHRRAGGHRGDHDRPPPPRRSHRGGGADRVRRRADRRALRQVDDRVHLRHLARRIGVDDERGGRGADAGGRDRAAGARPRRSR